MPKTDQRKSFVWQHFVKDGEMCRCLKCPYSHKPKYGSTSALAHHLRFVHKIGLDIEVEAVDVDNELAEDRDDTNISTNKSSINSSSISKDKGRSGATNSVRLINYYLLNCHMPIKGTWA